MNAPLLVVIAALWLITLVVVFNLTTARWTAFMVRGWAHLTEVSKERVPTVADVAEAFGAEIAPGWPRLWR